MPLSRNPWDNLAAHFEPKKVEEMEWDTADNVLLAWPVVLNFLKQKISDLNKCQVLDYGCGAGQFANMLFQLGLSVEGIDSSPAMIDRARSFYGSSIDFNVGRAVSVEPEKYDAITSIMTLQFVLDIRDTFRYLAKGIKPGGYLVFAVHNPEFVSDWAKIGYRYTEFESVEHPTNGSLSFGNTSIPIYIRSASEYNKLAIDDGLNSVLEEYPPFNHQFLSRYHVDGPTGHSEFLILGYKKKL